MCIVLYGKSESGQKWLKALGSLQSHTAHGKSANASIKSPQNKAAEAPLAQVAGGGVDSIVRNGSDPTSGDAVRAVRRGGL